MESNINKPMNDFATQILRIDDNCSEMEYINQIQESSFSEDVIIDGIMDISDLENTHLNLQDEALLPMDIVRIKSTQEIQSSTLEMQCLSFDIISKVTINDYSNVATNSTNENYFVPISWGVSKFASETETIVFSLFVKKIANGIQIPIPQKTVTISANKTLRYFVYGNVVDALKHKFAQILDIKSLPQILNTFQHMNVCNGLGTININHLSKHNLFKDYSGEWRSNECSLISKRKRCDRCIQIRQLAWKKEIRSKINGKLKHIHAASNPIDQRKIIMLRKKNLRERRQKNRAQRHVQLGRDPIAHEPDSTRVLLIGQLEH